MTHDLRRTVQRALNLVEGRANQQQVNIVTECPDAPVMVDGDPEQIHQVLVNLLLNGIEAMPDGGMLKMTIHRDDGRPRTCRVTVSDSGSGIPPQILTRIFEPFVTSKEGGTGLGLAISRRIAEEHGGTLLAVNREEGGATFTLELPVSAAIAASHTLPTVSELTRRRRFVTPRTAGARRPRRGSMSKLLVIDDEPGIHFSIGRVFAQEAVQVISAESAEEGLRLAAEESPDVILLDIRLGDRSGLEVFQDLRRIDPRSLIVFITGYGTTDTAIEAMKLGAYDYLVKPLDASQLQQVVNQAAAISRLMHVPTIVEDGDRPEDLPERLVGSGPAMQTVCKQIGRVAPQDVNVLILGESGTGKELVARAIYHHSRRNQAPFLAINCAAIPESLVGERTLRP